MISLTPLSDGVSVGYAALGHTMTKADRQFFGGAALLLLVALWCAIVFALLTV
jgi:hypothetical protein